MRDDKRREQVYPLLDVLLVVRRVAVGERACERFEIKAVVGSCAEMTMMTVSMNRHNHLTSAAKCCMCKTTHTNGMKGNAPRVEELAVAARLV